MKLEHFAATDIGRQRAHNEDTYLVNAELSLFIVADGMGGHAAGEVASQMTVQEIERIVRENADVIERYVKGKDADARKEIAQILEHAMQTACANVFHRGQSEPDKRGMGTTCSVLLIAGHLGFINHVGDSRIYLIRQGQLHQLTEDHSLVNELVSRGKIKRDQIDSSPYARHKNAVTRAVGAYESVDAFSLEFEVLPGDNFLLCSDGLHTYLKDDDLPKIMAAADLTEAPAELVALANAGGGQDNITAVVVRAKEGAEHAARARDLANRLDVMRSIKLFKRLKYPETMRLLNVLVVRDYEAGERLIEEGTPGAELFIIISGKVRLHKGDQLLTFLERGAYFGEMALVDQQDRSASATATERSRVLLLSRRDFYDVIRNEPVLATKLLWSIVEVLTERLRRTTTELSGVRLETQALELPSELLSELARRRAPPQ